MERHLCKQIRRLIFKMPVLPKAIYSFSVITLKILMTSLFFSEMEKRILKFIWNCKQCQTAKTILERQKQRGFTLPNFKTYNATVTKTVWYWHKNRPINQGDRI